MSEEKLYAVKNDEGKYWDFSDGSGFWILDIPDCPTTTSKEEAELVAKNQGSHAITLVEEPKKVVLSKEQAKIVEEANKYKFPASYISMNTDDYDGLEKLLMNAYVNGYTVAKKKKYLVYKVLGGKQKNKNVAQAYRSAVFQNTITWSIQRRESLSTLSPARFTESEIEHYGLQGCDKEEVTGDGMGC